MKCGSTTNQSAKVVLSTSESHGTLAEPVMASLAAVRALTSRKLRSCSAICQKRRACLLMTVSGFSLSAGQQLNLDQHANNVLLAIMTGSLQRMI